MQSVYHEFDSIRGKFNIKSFKSRIVTRKYSFELPGIPAESEYLKVGYSYKRLFLEDILKSNIIFYIQLLEPQLPTDLSGSTFSHIFGSNTSALENFVIKRKLMGHCWIQISNPIIGKKNVRKRIYFMF